MSPSTFFKLFTFNRKEGGNSIKKAAYRSGARLVDERTGRVFSYCGKRDVVLAKLAFPEPLPWSRQELWNANEVACRRWDARVSRDFVFAIPNVLSHEAQVLLAREMAN